MAGLRFLAEGDPPAGRQAVLQHGDTVDYEKPGAAPLTDVKFAIVISTDCAAAEHQAVAEDRRGALSDDKKDVRWRSVFVSHNQDSSETTSYSSGLQNLFCQSSN